MPITRVRAGVATAAAVLAAVAIGAVVTHHANRSAAAPSPSAAAIAVPRRSAPLSAPAVSSGPTPVIRPIRPAVQHAVVAASGPVSFSYLGNGFTVRAHVCAMQFVRPLDPPGEQHHTVCWVQHQFGVAPGSAAHGTTYVLGHSWARDAHEVLNPVSSRAMRDVLRSRGRTTRLGGVAITPVTALNGNTIILRTGRGILDYTVRSAYAVPKEQAGYVAPLMAQHTPDRLVLITCGERGAIDYDLNIIVNAYLSSSRAAAPASAA